MTDERLLRFYVSRWSTALRLWNDARKAAGHEDAIFIWIPKNAGTTVSTLLRDHGMVALGTPRTIRLCFRNSGLVTFGNQSVACLVEDGLISPDFVDRAFKFAISRDPYTRAVSLYRYLSHRIMSNWREVPNFSDFLQLISNGYYDRVGSYAFRGISLCNPQVEWLRGAWPDKIYKTEELNEFLADARERWGIESPALPHLNSSKSNDIELTGDQAKQIERIYAEDFEALGYRKRGSFVSMN